MGVFLREDIASVNPVFQATGYNDLSSGYALGTEAQQSWADSPVSQLTRTGTIGEAERGPVIAGGRGGVMRGEPTSPVLSPGEANERYGIKGELSFDQPVRQRAAELQNQYALDRLKRADILNRAETGFIPGSARVLTALGAAALDPVNVAVSFVPVMGEARFASLAGRIGLTGARLARGAAEGAVGQALIEPISLENAEAERRDYTAWDSLTNIIMGAGLGAGLHVGGGFLKDRMFGVPEFTPPAQHEAALRGAIAGILEDRPIRVAEAVQQMAPPRVPMIDVDPVNPAKSIVEFASNPDPRNKQMLRVGDIPDELVARIASDLGINVSGFDHVMQTSDVIHTLARHGEGSNLRPDEVPVRPEDLARVPEIVATADSIRSEKTHQGLDALVFTKRDGNTYVIVEEVRGKRHKLAFKSMRIKKAGGGGSGTTLMPPEEPQAIRPNREPDTADANITAEPLEDNTRFSDADEIEATSNEWREMVNAQRQTHELQPEEAHALAYQAAETKGFDRPKAPAAEVQEADEYAATKDEEIEIARAQGLLTEEDEVILKAANDEVTKAEQIGAGLRIAAACIARGLA